MVGAAERPAMPSATFRFYEELNDFLAPDRRKRAFEAPFGRAATVKNAIEALGVPHTEVELILVNGESVDFSVRLAQGDRVAVYPVFESLDVAPTLRVRREPMREPRFAADAHLGGLARLLRMAGFDTIHDGGFTDDELRRCAREERRVILTRDRALLMHADVTHGCYVHARLPRAQLAELVRRLQLEARVRPLTRCLECNAVLLEVDKASIARRVPLAIAAQYDAFRRCPACDRVYWEGSHVTRMRAALSEIETKIG
jgi:uncharacterized protein with PIN domain